MNFADPLGLSAWDWISSGVAMAGGALQVAAGTAICVATGWTGVGAVAGGVLMAKGMAAEGSSGCNMYQMAKGNNPTPNTSGTAGIVTSLITDDPTANAIASVVDLGANLASGMAGGNAARSALARAGTPGTRSRYMFDVNNFGTLSSADRFLTAEELAIRATQTSKLVDAVTMLGVGTTTGDTLGNLYRGSLK